jgi:FixJ family two-component response regulator
MPEPARVWIVDDDRSIRWVLEKALAGAGIATSSFADADSLARKLRSDVPDVVISDIRMPGTSGLQLLARLRAEHPELPVIITTAHSDLDSAVASYQGGAFEYLPKPFDIDEVVLVTKRALAHRRAQQSAAGVEAVRESTEIIGEAPAMQEVFPRDRPALEFTDHRADQRRVRHRQGTGRTRIAPPQPARCRTVHRAEHGRDPEGPDGVRAVRPREGRLHRRARTATRTLRAGRRRHAVSR